MKNIFKYIITVFLIVIQCINAGENSTHIANNNNALLISCYNNYQQPIYGGTPFVINQNGSAYNRKTRRALGQRKHKTNEDKAQKISDTIDNELLHIDKSCCGNYLIGKLNILLKLVDLKLAGKDALLKDLNEIDMYVKQTNNNVLDYLMYKNTFFYGLVRNLIDVTKYTIDKEYLKGSTIDTIYYEDRMFQSLSPLLSSYIGNKVKKEYQNFHVNNYKIESILPMSDMYFNLAPLKNIYKCNVSEMHCFHKHYEEIHMIRLQHNFPIKIDSIMISSDEQYIKAATDTISNKIIIWNIMTGEKHDNFQKEHWNWTKRDFLNKNNKFVHNESYYIELCQDRFLGFVLCTTKAKSTINVYMKPTFLSRLCQIAFMNSIHDNVELDALLHSDVVKFLTGFARTNLERAIFNAKLQNSNIVLS